ncbi:MAG: DUF7117 family protein [Halolamina sp.]
MKIRGERECQHCGTRWSYYETGAATCPDCGSLRSVGLDAERRRHTDSPAEIDLTPHRSALADGADLVDVAGDVATDCRAYLRKRGFVRSGDLLALDDQYLAVGELRTAIADYDRDRRVGVDRGHLGDENAERYLLELLNGADAGERPAPNRVPDSLAPARGLAAARAVEAYREDVSAYLDDEPDHAAKRLLERIRDQEKRVQALDGDVAPEVAELLIEACRALERYLNGDEEPGRAEALATVERHLDDLDGFENLD